MKLEERLEQLRRLRGEAAPALGASRLPLLSPR